MGKSKRGKPKGKSQRVVAPDLPRVETADFDDPEQHATWALAGLPHMRGAPLGVPTFMLRAISKRLWDCGFRYHPELRTIKYRPPHAGQGVRMLSSAGEWVPIDEPDPTPDSPDVAATLAALPDAQKRQIVNALGLQVGGGGGGGAAAAGAGGDGGAQLVPYLKADGSTVMVTPGQARAWARAKQARREAQS